MPNIREFQSPDLGLHPSETGVEATAAAARRIGGFYNQAADEVTSSGARIASGIKDVGDVAVKYIDHQQISAGAPAGTAMASNLDNAWNTVLKGGKDADGNVIPPADPNDDSVRQKFMEEQVEPALDKFKSGFISEGGQTWAESFTNNLRTHLSNKSHADMVGQAAVAVNQNVERTRNNLSSMVANDPSALDFALKQYDHAIGGIVDSSPMLDAATAASVKGNLKGKEDLVKSAAFAAVQQNPNFDLVAFQKKYGDYINGAEIKQFQKAAQVQAKSDAWTQTQLNTAQRKDIETKAAGELSDNWTKNVTYDETGQVHINPKAMQNILDIEKKYPGAATADSQKMISFLQAQQREKREVVNSDQKVRGDFLQRFSTTDNFPTEIEILRGQALHQLSPADTKEFLELRKAMIDRPGGDALKRDHSEFFKQYGPSIDAEMKLGNPTPLGAQALYRAEMDAYRQEETLRQKGLDPHLIYDPRSEYFFGNPKNISGYRPSLQDQLNYKNQLSTDKKRTGAAPDNVNLTGAGKSITSVQVTNAPVGTSVPKPAPPPPPEKGSVKDGYEFLGGSPGDAANWRKVK